MKFRPHHLWSKQVQNIRKSPQNTWFTDPCCKSLQTGHPVYFNYMKLKWWPTRNWKCLCYSYNLHIFRLANKTALCRQLHFVDWPNYEFESCNEKSGEGEVTCRHVKGKSLFAFASSASSVELVGWVLQLHTTKYCASNRGLVMVGLM